MLELTCRARRPERWPAHSRTRLRLGGADALHGAGVSPSRIVAVSNSASQRRYIDRRPRLGVDTSWSSPPTSIASSPTAASTASSRSKCSSTCATTERLFARIADWLLPGGRLFAHIFAHRRFAYPYDRGRRRTGWRALLHRRHDAVRRTLRAMQQSSTSRHRRMSDGTTRERPRPGWPTWTRVATAMTAILAAPMAATSSPAGGTDGGSSSWPVRRCSATATGRNGASPTTASEGDCDHGAQFGSR